MKQKKVWFVTGASKGLGLSLVKGLLTAGYPVTATSRSKADLIKSVGEHPNFLAVEMNLSDELSVAKAVKSTTEKFGRLDVVVNNAGYGQGGAVEEVTDKEARQNFEVNVFGLLNVIRATAPVLREQRSGHIFNISSIGGFVGAFSGWGVYCATKFAVSGLSEALSKDLEPFGVHTTLVYPGYFRTSFLEKGSLSLPSHPIAAYESSQESMRLHTQEINTNQPGDPAKAASAMIEVAKLARPPLHLFLGTDAQDIAKTKIDSLIVEIEKTSDITTSTDF